MQNGTHSTQPLPPHVIEYSEDATAEQSFDVYWNKLSSYQKQRLIGLSIDIDFLAEKVARVRRCPRVDMYAKIVEIIEDIITTLKYFAFLYNTE